MSDTIKDMIKDMIWDDQKGFFENLLGYAPYLSFALPGWGGIVYGTLTAALNVAGLGLDDLGRKIDQVISGKDLDSLDFDEVAKQVTADLGLDEKVATSFAIGLRQGRMVFAAPQLPGTVQKSLKDLLEELWSADDPAVQRELKRMIIRVLGKAKDGEIRAAINARIKDDNFNYKLYEEAAKRQTFSEHENAIYKNKMQELQNKLHLRDRDEQFKLRQMDLARESREHEHDLELERLRESRRIQGLPVTPEEHEQLKKRQVEEARRKRKDDVRQARELALAQQGKSLLGQRIKGAGIAAAIIGVLYAGKKLYDMVGDDNPSAATKPSQVNDDGSPTPSSVAKPRQLGPIGNYLNSELQSVLSR